MKKLHIHIMNNRNSAYVYQATEQQVREAMDRNEDIVNAYELTMGSSEYDYDRWTQSDLSDFLDKMRTANVLMGYTFPTNDIKGYAPNLKWIHFNSSGIEHITPFHWVPDGVQLTNSRGVHQPKSGETFATFLGMMNSAIPQLYTAQRQGKWDRIFTTVIKGKTLVVLGVGCQGGEVAKQGKKMGMRVIGIDPYVKHHPNCDEVVTIDRMQEVFAHADFLAISAPLTKETYRIIGEEQLGWLPQTASVMNVARGQLLDSDALDQKLRKGQIAGAILDVFDKEPLEEDSPLWSTPNLLLTPHVSSDDPVNYMPRCLDILMRNIRNYVNGAQLENLVDTAREY
ncbi:MAG: D-2-hydroxyacid dehydrogenase [Synergistaceae bacterium]|nr:D-2-hydroxyacid dehydrogenase [Synergistaceae bacterium]